MKRGAVFTFVLAFVVFTFADEVVYKSRFDDPHNAKLRTELRQAVDGAATQLQVNLITVLNGLANEAARRGSNVTKSLHVLTKAIVTNTVDLAGTVGYLPKLLALDLPTQFFEVLRLVRRNDLRVPSDVNTAIDNVLILSDQTRESGIAENLFGPITRFLPNLLRGVNDFLVTILDNAFGLIGGDPISARDIDLKYAHI